jgi:hypothetical protein
MVPLLAQGAVLATTELVIPAAKTAGRALLKANPRLQKRALDLISRATGGRVKDIDTAVSYATLSRNNLAVVAINAAKAGVQPAELLPEADIAASNNKELKALANRVRAAFSDAYAKIDAQSVITNDGQEQTLMLSVGVINKVSDLLGIRSDAALSQAHVTLRMWLGISEAEHTHALQMRRVARG